MVSCDWLVPTVRWGHDRVFLGCCRVDCRCVYINPSTFLSVRPSPFSSCSFAFYFVSACGGGYVRFASSSPATAVVQARTSGRHGCLCAALLFLHPPLCFVCRRLVLAVYFLLPVSVFVFSVFSIVLFLVSGCSEPFWSSEIGRASCRERVCLYV